MTRTLRAATSDVLRHHRLTALSADPGSTEVTFRTDPPTSPTPRSGPDR